MKTKLFAALTLSLGLLVNAQAQVPASTGKPSLDQLFPGYSPTVFNSKDEVQKVFDNMDWSFRNPHAVGPITVGQGSQCYMRAEIWSYDFDRNQNVKAMKAFVFYTHAYKEAYKKMHKGKKFDWWFHVTPYLLARNTETQAIEEWTVDATFSNELLAMKPWTDLFVDTKRQCAEFVPYQQFRCEVEGASDDCPHTVIGTEHCYLVRVPATIYDPTDIEAFQAGKRGLEWNRDQVTEAVKKAPLSSSKKDWMNKLGISKFDIENSKLHSDKP